MAERGKISRSNITSHQKYFQSFLKILDIGTQVYLVFNIRNDPV